ncbi:hypothetical protein [Alienimonas californiensis]|uniref:YHS domain protein n=1 Tax=Alienimonas californiensis TaxID=2527989 RepID=A0A517PB58_9PLAN|nr:hypothetical protein [Alienimonas californiensis]QDT16596.1 hypothetical protein CA12_27020 [Alienimonas californiensis]
MTFRALLSVPAAALAALAVGCAVESSPDDSAELTSADAPEAAPVVLINETCPLMGGEADPAVTTEWNGQTVGFCCASCIPEWDELSEEQKAEKIAAAKAGETENEMHDHNDGHEHGDA